MSFRIIYWYSLPIAYIPNLLPHGCLVQGPEVPSAPTKAENMIMMNQ